MSDAPVPRSSGPGRFTGKVCIVTGGGSGIGRAACLRFAGEGGKVLAIGLDTNHLNETVESIAAAGGEGTFMKADVADSQQVQAAIDLAVKRWGKIDVLVNNAAMMTFKPVVELSEAEWDQVLAVSLKGVFLFCKYAIPHMPEGSAIVNTSSVHAHATEEGVGPYAASKGGLEAFIRVLALELESRNIRVNCVAPGAVDTPMLWNNPNVKSGKEKVEGVVGQPEDIAAAICFLASTEAKFINGTTLIADGGRLDAL
jgi:NAD(P)-dependent dehydrogenase (short-subunit alcohol dehydrogenase family)